MKSNLKKIVLITITILCFYGCDMNTKNRLNCICLIDYSGSLTEESLKNYSEIITNTVFSNLNEADRLIVIPIDEGAKTQAIRIVYEDLSTMKFSKSTDGFTNKQDSTFKRINDYVQSKRNLLFNEIISQKKLRAKFTDKTDIISALEQVQLLLERPSEKNFWNKLLDFVSGKTKLLSENSIIIFSDMIHESNEFDFAVYRENKSLYEIALEKLVQNNKIPNLKDCLIFVDGRTGNTNKQVENIKNFWTDFFEKSGANLVSYDYDCRKEIESFMLKRRELNK